MTVNVDISERGYLCQKLVHLTAVCSDAHLLIRTCKVTKFRGAMLILLIVVYLSQKLVHFYTTPRSDAHLVICTYKFIEYQG